MMPARELKQWLATLGDANEIGIDDGGMTLVVDGSDAYLEVGGTRLLCPPTHREHPRGSPENGTCS